jgi:hypothetical protein
MKDLKKSLKAGSLDEMIDRHIGEIGTKKRDTFENKLTSDLPEYQQVNGERSRPSL